MTLPHRKVALFRRWVFFTLSLALLGFSAAGPAAAALGRIGSLRELEMVLSGLSAKDLATAIPCARLPLASPGARAALERILPGLAEFPHRAAAFCLLGEPSAGLAIYRQRAQAGDAWAAMQAYFLLARAGDPAGARQVLENAPLSVEDLGRYAEALAEIEPGIDSMPLAARAVQVSPQNILAWQMWAGAADRANQRGDPAQALSYYQAGLDLQDRLGIKAGRSTFLQNIGHFYQVYAKPPDLLTALKYYDQAVLADNYLSPHDQVHLYLYRGETCRRLKPAYTGAQVLSEFEQAQKLEPENITALLNMESVYLYDLKDFNSAQAALERLDQLRPLDPATQYLWGDYYSQTGDLARAVGAYENALRLRPGWKDAQDRLAAVQAKMKGQAP